MVLFVIMRVLLIFMFLYVSAAGLRADEELLPWFDLAGDGDVSMAVAIDKIQVYGDEKCDLLDESSDCSNPRLRKVATYSRLLNKGVKDIGKYEKLFGHKLSEGSKKNVLGPTLKLFAEIEHIWAVGVFSFSDRHLIPCKFEYKSADPERWFGDEYIFVVDDNNRLIRGGSLFMNEASVLTDVLYRVDSLKDINMAKKSKFRYSVTINSSSSMNPDSKVEIYFNGSRNIDAFGIVKMMKRLNGSLSKEGSYLSFLNLWNKADVAYLTKENELDDIKDVYEELKNHVWSARFAIEGKNRLIVYILDERGKELKELFLTCGYPRF